MEGLRVRVERVRMTGDSREGPWRREDKGRCSGEEGEADMCSYR